MNEDINALGLRLDREAVCGCSCGTSSTEEFSRLLDQLRERFSFFDFTCSEV